MTKKTIKHRDQPKRGRPTRWRSADFTWTHGSPEEIDKADFGFYLLTMQKWMGEAVEEAAKRSKVEPQDVVFAALVMALKTLLPDQLSFGPAQKIRPKLGHLQTSATDDLSK